MSSSESEWDSERGGEESDDATSSDTDSEVKHRTYPHRNLRWPVGDPLPVNPVRGTTWDKFKNVRVPPMDQRDGSRFVPGRLPRLQALVEDEAEHKEGGSAPARAFCLACDKKVDNVLSDKDMVDHVTSCWGPTDEAPLDVNDPRKPTPTLLGIVPIEEDYNCLLISVTSPSPYGGEFRLVLSIPSEEASLSALDLSIREHWMEKGGACCDHFSMFLMRTSGEEGEVDQMLYKGYQENMAILDMKIGVEGQSRAYHQEGEVVWARPGGGGHWPAVLLAEESSGLVGKMAEGREPEWCYRASALWHVVFLGRKNQRAWVKDDWSMRPFNGVKKLEDGLKLVGEDMFSWSGSDKKSWLKAVAVAIELVALEDVGKVLVRVTELGLVGTGELLPDQDQSTNRVNGVWGAWPDSMWRFCKDPFERDSPFTQPIEKLSGFSYWPLMGGAEQGRPGLLDHDRTDNKLTDILASPSHTLLYHYHLVPGFTTRCKVRMLGEQLVRLRGRVRETVSPSDLERDPEYFRDLERLDRMGITEEDLSQPMPVSHRGPRSTEFTLLLESEAPFMPCSVCRIKTAQFVDTGPKPDWRGQEDPDLRLQQFAGAYCSTQCARDLGEIGKVDMPVGENSQVSNSPRFGMCKYLRNNHIKLHVMPVWKLDYLRFGPKPAGFVGLFSTGWLDDERAEGRHHPLWTKSQRREYRDRKRKWQDKIFRRIQQFKLKLPPVDLTSKHYFD